MKKAADTPRARVARFVKAVGLLGGIGILFMMASTTGDALGRYLFNSPIKWSIEINEYLLVMATYLGLAYTEAQEGHVSITLLTSRLPTRVQAILNILTRVVVLALCLVIVWRSGQVAWVSYTMQEVSWTPSQTPVYPSKLMVTIGCLVLSMQLVVKIRHYIHVARYGGERTKLKPEELPLI